ncbi:hypothetical protein FGB62_121g018 [Gracilaria domingensis]|nr:hypothetical protein FGB62_121g018 [Gracilaria domingensis]
MNESRSQYAAGRANIKSNKRAETTMRPLPEGKEQSVTCDSLHLLQGNTVVCDAESGSIGEKGDSITAEIKGGIPTMTIDNEDVACRRCGRTPCYWVQFGSYVVETISEKFPIADSSQNNEARKCAYKNYIYERYGFMGKGNRIQIPHCVLEGIRSMWPDAAGTYMGYRDD